MEFYGTLGDACWERETLEALFRAGMTGARLNLSHTTLEACAPLLEERFWPAARQAGVEAKLIVDLQGPELRVGTLKEPVSLAEGAEVLLGAGGIPVPAAALAAARTGDEISLDDSALQGFFGVDRSDRDPQHARDAFNDFSKLVRGYPNSQYATDAYKRMVFLKDRLAKYELSVVDYYTDRGAWVAVVNRVEGMLRDYPDTQATRDALPLMENAYRQMQMNAQAEKVAKIIAANSSNT